MTITIITSTVTLKFVDKDLITVLKDIKDVEDEFYETIISITIHPTFNL